MGPFTSLATERRVPLLRSAKPAKPAERFQPQDSGRSWPESEGAPWLGWAGRLPAQSLAATWDQLSPCPAPGSNAVPQSLILNIPTPCMLPRPQPMPRAATPPAQPTLHAATPPAQTMPRAATPPASTAHCHAPSPAHATCCHGAASPFLSQREAALTEIPGAPAGNPLSFKCLGRPRARGPAAWPLSLAMQNLSAAGQTRGLYCPAAHTQETLPAGEVCRCSRQPPSSSAPSPQALTHPAPPAPRSQLNGKVLAGAPVSPTGLHPKGVQTAPPYAACLPCPRAPLLRTGVACNPFHFNGSGLDRGPGSIRWVWGERRAEGGSPRPVTPLPDGNGYQKRRLCQ